MKKLSNKEKEILELFWQHGPMLVRDLAEHFDEPRPHFNTLSTLVHRLEAKGYLGHEQIDRGTYRYFAKISEQDYAKNGIFSLVDDYFGNSYKSLVSTFIREEKISVEDLMEIMKEVEEMKSE